MLRAFSSINTEKVFIYGGFYKFISDDFAICFEQIAVRNEGAMRAL